MKSTEEIVEMLRQYKLKNAPKYGIETIILFGSAARGEHNEKSDVDVCIKTKDAIDFFTLRDIQIELKTLLKTKVDLLTLHNGMLPSLRKNIDKDAIYI